MILPEVAPRSFPSRPPPRCFNFPSFEVEVHVWRRGRHHWQRGVWDGRRQGRRQVKENNRPLPRRKYLLINFAGVCIALGC